MAIPIETYKHFSLIPELYIYYKTIIKNASRATHLEEKTNHVDNAKDIHANTKSDPNFF